VLPQSRPKGSDANGRVFLILIDDLHFEPELTPHVRQLIQTIVDTLLHEGDLVGVVSTGPSFIEVGLTYDKKIVAEAAKKIRGSGYLPSEIFKMIENSQGPGDIRNKAQMAFYTAYNMMADLESVTNRRKAVIYISTGYDFDPFAEGRNSRDRIMGGRFSDPLRFVVDEENPYFSLGRVTADIDLFRLQRELTLSANRANASIYTIDPRGLAGTVDAGQYVDQSEWRSYIQKTISTLKYLSEETGGFPIVDTNDFAGALKRVDAETSDYYVLGFYSTNPDPNKRTRMLEVKVDRPGVTVSARRGYSLKDGRQACRPATRAKRNESIYQSRCERRHCGSRRRTSIVALCASLVNRAWSRCSPRTSSALAGCAHEANLRASRSSFFFRGARPRAACPRVSIASRSRCTAILVSPPRIFNAPSSPGAASAAVIDEAAPAGIRPPQQAQV
jgi:VWFA-related protein